MKNLYILIASAILTTIGGYGIYDGDKHNNYIELLISSIIVFIFGMMFFGAVFAVIGGWA